MKFFQNGCNGGGRGGEGDGKVLLEIGGWFYDGRDGKFLKSLYI